jgi:hypothetical protein
LLFGDDGVDHLDGGTSFDVCVGENLVAGEIG